MSVDVACISADLVPVAPDVGVAVRSAEVRQVAFLREEVDREGFSLADLAVPDSVTSDLVETVGPRLWPSILEHSHSDASGIDVEHSSRHAAVRVGVRVAAAGANRIDHDHGLGTGIDWRPVDVLQAVTCSAGATREKKCQRNADRDCREHPHAQSLSFRESTAPTDYQLYR